jgi:hypothetical protein
LYAKSDPRKGGVAVVLWAENFMFICKKPS